MDRDQLAAIPDPVIARSAAIEHGIADSVAYLDSSAARASLAIDVYWPKWHSPWWHMLLLLELGEAARIPARTVAAFVDALVAFPLHMFPIAPGEAPPGTHPSRDIMCHCGAGSAWQVLAACGVDVARAVPWLAGWTARYQMADGGLDCDDAAYRAREAPGVCASSMVGTLAPFEAALVEDPHGAVAARAAQFLIGRALHRGSASVHNAEERAAAPAWRALTFPRFYFYDVLRGLAALVRWAEATGAALPAAAIAGVVDELCARFPDGVVTVGRQAFAHHTTITPERGHTPAARVPATTFPLLDATSVIGAASPALTAQWAAARRGVIRLIDAGQIA
ncbi:MAG TPA: hypothetical protein VFP84_07130 [Kofleriaceae bacterium]|nr:hypothetical protein [Kofleriaceae bacterium]